MKKTTLILISIFFIFGCKLGPKTYEVFERESGTVKTEEGTFFVTIDYLQETRKTYRPKDMARLSNYTLQSSRHLYRGQTPQAQECMDVFTIIVANDEEHYHKFDNPEKSDGISSGARGWKFPKVPGTDFAFVVKQSEYEEPDFSLFLHEIGHRYGNCKFGSSDSNHNDERIWANLSQDSVLANAEMMECHYRLKQGYGNPGLCEKYINTSNPIEKEGYGNQKFVGNHVCLAEDRSAIEISFESSENVTFKYWSNLPDSLSKYLDIPFSMKKLSGDCYEARPGDSAITICAENVRDISAHFFEMNDDGNYEPIYNCVAEK